MNSLTGIGFKSGINRTTTAKLISETLTRSQLEVTINIHDNTFIVDGIDREYKFVLTYIVRKDV